MEKTATQSGTMRDTAISLQSSSRWFTGYACGKQISKGWAPPSDCRCARRFERQLRADCALLEALRVMDYSLLLGIHSRSGGGLASTPQHTDAVRTDCLLGAVHSGTGEHCGSSSPCC